MKTRIETETSNASHRATRSKEPRADYLHLAGTRSKDSRLWNTVDKRASISLYLAWINKILTRPFWQSKTDDPRKQTLSSTPHICRLLVNHIQWCVFMLPTPTTACARTWATKATTAMSEMVMAFIVRAKMQKAQIKMSLDGKNYWEYEGLSLSQKLSGP